MDRKSFLAALKRTMWWRLPPEELSAVLEDYNEYFDSGIAAGRSEAELCKQFGKPSEIATDIVAERGSKYYSVALASIGLCGGLLFVAITVLVSPSWLYNIMYADYILYFAIFALSSLSILLTKRTVGTAISVKTSRSVTAMHITMGCLSVFALLSVVTMLQGLFLDTWITPYMMGRVDPSILGPTLSFILTTLMVVAIVMWLVTIYKAAALYRWQLIFITVNAAALSLLVDLIIIMGMLSDPDSFMLAIYWTIGLSLLQLLPVILVFTPCKGGKTNG